MILALHPLHLQDDDVDFQVKLSKLVNGMGCALVTSWNKYVCVHMFCVCLCCSYMHSDLMYWVGMGYIQLYRVLPSYLYWVLWYNFEAYCNCFMKACNKFCRMCIVYWRVLFNIQTSKRWWGRQIQDCFSCYWSQTTLSSQVSELSGVYVARNIDGIGPKQALQILFNLVAWYWITIHIIP